MESIKIPVQEDVCQLVQLLAYELSGYINLLKSVIADGRYNLEMYERLMGEYHNKNKEYLLVMDEVKRMYMPPKYRTDEYTMTVLFNENVIVIERRSFSKCSK